MASIDHAQVEGIAQFLSQLAPDHLEGAAAIMAGQVLHVLKQERSRPVSFQDAQDIKEERALGFVLEPVQPAQRILL